MIASTRAGLAVATLAAVFILSAPLPAVAGGGCVFFNANDTDCDGLDDTTVDPCPGTPAVSSPGLMTTLNRCAGPVATCAAAAGNCGLPCGNSTPMVAWSPVSLRVKRM